MQAHVLSKHPGSSSGIVFVCSHCPFKSVRYESYVSHVATHSSSKTDDEDEEEEGGSRLNGEVNVAQLF